MHIHLCLIFKTIFLMKMQKLHKFEEKTLCFRFELVSWWYIFRCNPFIQRFNAGQVYYKFTSRRNMYTIFGKNLSCSVAYS